MQQSEDTRQIPRGVAKVMTAGMAKPGERAWRPRRTEGSFTPCSDRTGAFTTETRKKRVLTKP